MWVFKRSLESEVEVKLNEVGDGVTGTVSMPVIATDAFWHSHQSRTAFPLMTVRADSQMTVSASHWRIAWRQCRQYFSNLMVLDILCHWSRNGLRACQIQANLFVSS